MTVLPTKLRCFIYLLAFIFTSVLSGQTDFKKGYFIDNNNNTTECLIKDFDWKNYPDEFSYKLNESAEIQIGNLETVSKFEIYNSSIFIRSEVEVDVNSTSSNKLTNFAELELTTKIVFLKLLVEGKANLFAYKDANSKRFYLQTETNNTALLKYKEYFNEKNQIAKNQTYKRQLYDNMKCLSMETSMVNNTDYDESDLIALFVAYNTCENELSYTFKKKKRKNTIHLRLRPGVDLATADVDNSDSGLNNNKSFKFDTSIAFRFGVELEYILPFNNKKWAFVLEPTYRSLTSEKTISLNPNSPIERSETVTLDYSSVEIPFSIRQYSFINDNSALFFDLSFLIDFPFNGTIDYSSSTDFEISSYSNLAFGIGYLYQDKYSIHARFSLPRTIISEDVATDANYNAIGIILGYKLF